MGIITKEYPLQCWGGLNKNAQVNSFQTYSLPSSLLVNVRMTLSHTKNMHRMQKKFIWDKGHNQVLL